MLPSSFRYLFATLTLLALVASSISAAESNPLAAGVDFDLQGFIDTAVKAGQKNIVVPPGRYRVKPQHSQHLVLRDLHDITISANGVEMICTQTTRALSISQCSNLILRGLIIDYDPLPYTQGRITALSPDKKIHEIELFDGYPRAEKANTDKYEIFRPDTRTLRCHTYGVKREVVDSSHLRLTKNGGSSANDPEQVGDIIAINAEDAPNGSAAHAVECSSNKNVTLEDVIVYASNCFGFLEYNCELTTYRGCRVDRRPFGTDLIKREPRIRSSDADAFHSKHAILGPRLIGCVARFQGDDCLNICGDYHMVMNSTGNVLRVLAKHELNIAVGDPVELVSYDGTRVPDAIVTAIEKDEATRPDEREFLSKQRMDEGLRTNHSFLAKAFKITLNRDAALPMGSLICSTRRIGNGFLVSHCTFGFNRSRGILIKASDGVISDCTLQGSWEVAILISPEFWWLEAGSASNVIISNNTISDCPTPGIVVQATGGNGKVAPAGAHSAIAITGNSFSKCALPYILCTSTDGLTLTKNKFPDNEQPSQAGWGRQYVQKSDLGKPLVLLECMNVKNDLQP